MPPQRTLVPLERFEGTRPRKAELAWVGEAGEVADLGDHGDGDDQGDTPHRLHCLHHRCHRPAGQELGDLALQAPEPGLSVLDRVDIVLEHDLGAGCLKRTVVSQRR
jgi:hypothetical protein